MIYHNRVHLKSKQRINSSHVRWWFYSLFAFQMYSFVVLILEEYLMLSKTQPQLNRIDKPTQVYVILPKPENETTLAAISEIEKGGGKVFENVDDLFKDLEN